jgi:hypothetical protein
MTARQKEKGKKSYDREEVLPSAFGVEASGLPLRVR